ncbi:MAG: dihydrolipoamide acetyltransferase family protein [Spirochaetales bacterium]
MATEVLMPRQGQTVESCVILEWKKKEGDQVQKGETLCEVETDKAVFSVEAPEDGTVLKVLFPEGADVPVLTPIAYIGTKGEQIEAPSIEAPSSEGPATSGVAGSSGQPAPSPTTTDSPPSSSPSLQGEAGIPSPSPARNAFRISPRAMKLARQHGIQPETLVGTGPKGRIIERDVRKAIEGSQQVLQKAPAVGTERQAAPATANLGSAGTPVPLTGTRKVIAQRMLESMQIHAQYTLHALADARAILRWRNRFKESPEPYGCQGITINDLVLFVVARTLPRFPDLNAYWMKDSIQRFPDVHLGVAVDTPKGLLVPVIRNAHALSLVDLSREAKRLAQACIEGRIPASDLTGGTFTVTNLGNLGVQYFTPILNSPQVAILGVGTIQPHPVMEGEKVEFHPHIGLSLTADHQAVDGAPAARFLKAVADGITDVDFLLAGA